MTGVLVRILPFLLIGACGDLKDIVVLQRGLARQFEAGGIGVHLNNAVHLRVTFSNAPVIKLSRGEQEAFARRVAESVRDQYPRYQRLQTITIAFDDLTSDGSYRFTPADLVLSREAYHQALTDSLATLFDSLSAIHRDHPDTGLLRRLHPPADTVQHVEGTAIESFTGDSLFRRVRALHVPVRAMAQRFTNRNVRLLDADHAVLTAVETVDWTDAAGPHRYAGVLTIVVERRDGAWAIRAYRGT